MVQNFLYLFSSTVLGQPVFNAYNVPTSPIDGHSKHAATERRGSTSSWGLRPDRHYEYRPRLGCSYIGARFLLLRRHGSRWTGWRPAHRPCRPPAAADYRALAAPV